MFFRRSFIAAMGCAASLATTARAAHPLLTDDTDVQGAGRWQWESNADRSRQGAQRSLVSSHTLTFGASDDLDVALTLTHAQQRSIGQPSQSGLGDTLLQAKWRAPPSPADSAFTWGLKPILLLPTGDANAGLGHGRVGGSLLWLGQYKSGRLTVLGNLGVVANANVQAERPWQWTASAAGLWSLHPQWRALLEVTASRPADPTTQSTTRSALLGVIWSPSERLDVDAGWRVWGGVPGPAHTLGAGLTWRW